MGRTDDWASRGKGGCPMQCRVMGIVAIHPSSGLTESSSIHDRDLAGAKYRPLKRPQTPPDAGAASDAIGAPPCSAQSMIYISARWFRAPGRPTFAGTAGSWLKLHPHLPHRPCRGRPSGTGQVFMEPRPLALGGRPAGRRLQRAFERPGVLWSGGPGSPASLDGVGSFGGTVRTEARPGPKAQGRPVPDDLHSRQAGFTAGPVLSAPCCR